MQQGEARSAAREAGQQKISEEHLAELSRLDLDYWWYAVRLAHIKAILRARARAGPFTYLDFGGGTGAIAAHLIEAFAPSRSLVIDGTAGAVEAARGRGVAAELTDLEGPLALPFEPDVVTALDVLEHLDHPVEALARLADCCAAGALLVVSVPALLSLHGRWDELAGHRRRYTRALLRAELAEGGWVPRRVRYIFAPLALPVWIERRILRRTRGRFEFPRVSRGTNALLRLAGYLERRLGSPFPFGTSVLATAARQADVPAEAKAGARRSRERLPPSSTPPARAT